MESFTLPLVFKLHRWRHAERRKQLKCSPKCWNSNVPRPAPCFYTSGTLEAEPVALGPRGAPQVFSACGGQIPVCVCVWGGRKAPPPSLFPAVGFNNGLHA